MARDKTDKQERLPFDPGRMKGAAKEKLARGSGESVRPLQVSELAALIDQVLRAGLPARVTVIGEISGMRVRTHRYFDLKDADAVINCVMFASAARSLRFNPQNGAQVILRGRVEFYPKQGRTQLYVESMEPAGEGDLDRQFRQLCEELKRLGYFDPVRKRSLPVFPNRIAVITSRSAAAWQDVINTAKRRCPATELALVDVRVQGEGAASEVARAIRWVSDRHETLGIEAILITRGGGSMEDLWAFNERVVADAVFQSRVPVVAAIGHETDVTVAELVADERCATPTQAAMRLTPARDALAEQLVQLDRRALHSLTRRMAHERERMRGLQRATIFADAAAMLGRLTQQAEQRFRSLSEGARHRCARHRIRLEELHRQLSRLRPEEVYAQRRARLSVLETAMSGAIRARTTLETSRLDVNRLAECWVRSRSDRMDQLHTLERELSLSNPLSILQRGYSVTFSQGGKAVRSVRDVEPGDWIDTRISDGSIRSKVNVSGARASQSAIPQRVPRRRSNDPADRSQLPLF